MGTDHEVTCPLKDMRQLLTECCGSQAWVEGMWARQPFVNSRELFSAASEVWKNLKEEDWLEAFAHHPRIGGEARGEAKKEQSGVASADEKVRAALAEGNRRYEEKFGFVFLMCATGKTANEMLEALHLRFKNDRATELKIAVTEQAKIMQLRLERMAL